MSNEELIPEAKPEEIVEAKRKKVCIPVLKGIKQALFELNQYNELTLLP